MNLNSTRQIWTALLAIFLFLIFIGCAKYKEEAPFEDGMYFEYRYGTLNKTYNINHLDDNNFKIVETDSFYKATEGKLEMLVDSYGKVYECRKKRYKGKFSPIWIPVHDMEIGDEYDKRERVDRIDKWEKWEVLVIKDIPTGAENYYELKTGYFVGSEARSLVGSGKKILEATNADIPTID